MRGRHLPVALLTLAGLAGVAGCGGGGGGGGGDGGGIVGGLVGGAGTGRGPSGPGSSTTTAGPATSGPSTTLVPPSTAPSTTAPATTVPASPLRLDGDDLGVTRVGAPFREAVVAVSTVLGRPSGDPAPDTACIGAEDETTWGVFRLASSGGRVSGWLSTSPTLRTPAGVAVGTTVAQLRRAYGDRVEVRPPPEPDGLPVFVVRDARLGGTLSGEAAADTVSSLVNGTCEAA